jgi:histone deacetylase 1/2
MDAVMGFYRPDALVIQCGADSLSKDRLGHLNLSMRGHAECLNYMFRFGVPTVVLGGGGYTIENVSRCWAYETSVILGLEVDDQIPAKDQFYNCYEHDNHKLHFPIEARPN